MKEKLSREWLKFDSRMNLYDIHQEIPKEILEKIVLYYIKDLNLGNRDLINDLISMIAFPLISPRDFLKISKQHFNPTNKKGASKRSMGYWTLRGWSDSESKSKVSHIQRMNSPRCIEYWVSRGRTLEQSKILVSKSQAREAIEYHKTLKENDIKFETCFTKAFWVKRGHSTEDAKEIVSSIQRSNALKNLKKYTREERNKQRPQNLSFWLSRGKCIEDYENFMSESRFCSYNSRIAREFCYDLRSSFTCNKIYCIEKEYGKYIPEYGYVRYDYVDLTTKVVVEFNGEYWHASKDAKAHDKKKKDFMEEKGFRYFVVTDKEYSTNRKECVNKLIERINYVN